MPRYFFDIRDGRDIIDDDGTELPDLNAARVAAVNFAGEALADVGGEFWVDDHEWRVDVSDEDRVLLFTLVFMAVEAPRAAEQRRAG